VDGRNAQIAGLAGGLGERLTSFRLLPFLADRGKRRLPQERFARRRNMGTFVSSHATKAAAVIGTAAILALNLVLVPQTLGVRIPGLAAG
jgi:hypothetical protein